MTIDLFLKRIFNQAIGFLLSMSVLLIISSCEFSPGNIPETVIEKPSEIAPMMEIDLTPEKDTLKLAEPAIITYRFNAYPRKVHWVQFYFDDKLLFERDYSLDTQLHAELDPRPYDDGLHRLEIKVFTSSGSGSIADKLQGEGYLYQLFWPVIVDHTPVRPLKILSVEPEPGGTFIRWEKFDHGIFKNYTVQKVADFDLNVIDLAVIADPKTNEYFDAGYLEGEKVYYSVFLNGYPGEGKHYSQLPGPISATWNGGFEATVTWHPTQNPNRLDYYRIVRDDINSSENEMHFPLGEEALALKNLLFGADVRLKLQYVPKTSNTNYSFSGLEPAETKVVLGDPIPVHELTKQVPGSNNTLMNIGNRLVLFDHDKGIRIDSLDFGSVKLRAYRISPNGDVVYTLAGNLLQAWNINGFNSLGSVDITKIDYDLSQIYDITVSSDFKILFATSGEKIMVYDFMDRTVLIASAKSTGRGRISPDGKKILVRYTANNTYYRYYQINGNQLDLIGEQEFAEQSWGTTFFFSNPKLDQVVICTLTHLQIRKASDFSLINSFDIPYVSFRYYDPENNRIILLYNAITNENQMIQLPGGEVIQTLYINYSTVLHRNYLIGQNGRQLNLNNL